MNEDEALERVDSIGQAFANDLNDGDGLVVYEGVSVTDGGNTLLYSATLEDGTEIEHRWYLTHVGYSEKKDLEDAEHS